jgi:mRNA-degrading endonuclease toxin of MazEF toxin-antitoxin module
MCEQIRSLATERLGSSPFGSVSAAVLGSVENRLRLLLVL